MSVTPAQLKELQKRISGLVVRDKAVRQYFASDASVLRLEPGSVLYPSDWRDLQAVLGYLSQEAAKGRAVSLTTRGGGTGTSGGSLGMDVVAVLPTNLHKTLRITKDSVSVQAGMRVDTLLELLRTHDRTIPALVGLPAGSTVGGAVAADAGGFKSAKYSTIRRALQSLKAVLADGSVIETKPLNPRALSRKKGLMNLEGEIYRQVDSLIIDHLALIKQLPPTVRDSAAGYALGLVKGKLGNFDLAQLFAGAEGTLGVITEVTLSTESYQPRSRLVVSFFDDLGKFGEAALLLQRLKPSALEVIDGASLAVWRQKQPRAAELLPEATPQLAVLVEFDNASQFRRARNILNKMAASYHVSGSPQDTEAWWQVQRSAPLAFDFDGKKPSLPLATDLAIPLEKLADFLRETTKILQKRKLPAAIRGSASSGRFHLHPQLDLSKPKDRKAGMATMDDIYSLVIKLGGSPAAGGSGRLKAPYLEKVYGHEIFEVFRDLKHAADPHNLLNPGVKLGTSKKDLEESLGIQYSAGHYEDL
jgi:FAD/FMN-containing dehydrogenase